MLQSCVLTSSFAALLHAILVNVQCEQHVGVASLVLVRAGSAGAARGDGCIEEEGGFLSRRSTKLALILELREEEDEESKVRVSKRRHAGLEKEDRCKKDTGEKRKARAGSQLIGPRHAFLAH